MLGILLIGWRQEIQGGLRALSSRPVGRWALATSAVLLVAGIVAAGARVRVAIAASAEFAPVELASARGPDGGLPAGYRVEDRPAPLIVRETVAARRRLAAEGVDAAAVVLTLDPWRDTPSRLEYLASRLGLETDERLLGGEVSVVEEALDRWDVPRERDLRTGDIVHPPLVYVIDVSGRVAFAAAGGEDLLVDLVRQVATSS
jgi:hypothetical protein